MAGARPSDGAAPQQRAHPRDELADAERLGQVVVGAALEAEHLVGLFAPRRQHQDRHVAVHRLAPHRPAHRHAVEPRQHQVENQQIERLSFARASACRAVSRGDRRQTFELQMQHDQIADMRVVFDDEDTAACLAFGLWRRRGSHLPV